MPGRSGRAPARSPGSRADAEKITLAQTAAHLADYVIPPVPVRQWVISVPKRLRGMLADRPRAVAALTKIFLTEIERSVWAAAGLRDDADTSRAARPRLGGVSFLHRFGSALNHHVHLHACVTDGVFVPAAAGTACDTPPTFLLAQVITHVHLAALTERVRRRMIRWFRLARRLDGAAAANMLAWENNGFSIDFFRQDHAKPGPIQKILTHLGEPPEPPPVSPARGPPTDWGELVQVLQGGKLDILATAFWGRETKTRGSRAAHQLGNRCGRAIGRAILRRGFQAGFSS